MESYLTENNLGYSESVGQVHQSIILLFHFSITIRCCIASGFLVIFINRHCDLRQIASMALPKTNDQKIYLYIRIFLVFLQNIQLFLCIIFSFALKKYWLRAEHYEYFTFFMFFPIFVNFYQIKLIREEYYKYVPTMWPHKLFWIINLILQTVIISLLVIQLEDAKLTPDSGLSTSSINWIFPLASFLGNSMQVIFSLIKKQDRPEFEDYSCFSYDIPNFLESVNYQNLSQSILVQNHNLLQVSTKKQITQIGNQIIIKIKVENKQSNQDYELSKSVDEILEFSKIYLEELQNQDPNSKTFTQIEQFDLESEFQNNTIKIPSITKRYLSTIASNLEYYNKIFLNFLQIPEDQQTQFLDMKYMVEDNSEEQPSSIQKNKLQTFAPQETLVSNGLMNKSNKKARSLSQIHKRSQLRTNNNQSNNQNILINEQFCIYFKITSKKYIKLQDHYEYEYVIQTVSNSIQNWTIKKRYNDFKYLHERLKEQLKIQLPKLPVDYIFKIYSDNSDVMKRMNDLENYLIQLLNDQIYFCQDLFDFIQYKGQVGELIPRQQESSLQDLTAILEGKCYSVTINNKSVAQYKFKISRANANNWFIYKRYNDFYELDQQLKIHYKNLVEMHQIDEFPKNFPELPPKMSPFGLKTSIAYRGPKLQQYLNQLFQLQKIEQSFLFRIFIEITSQSNISVSIEQAKSGNSSILKIDQGDTNHQYINIDDLQIEVYKNLNQSGYSQ